MPTYSVDALYETLSGEMLSVSHGRVFLVNADGTFTEFTGATVLADRCYYWAEDGQHVYLAHGGKLARLDVAHLTVTLLNENTPNAVTHVCRSKGYLICNGNDVIIASTTWELAQVFSDTTGFYSAVIFPDKPEWIVIAASHTAVADFFSTTPDNSGRLYLSKDNGLTWIQVYSVPSIVLFAEALCAGLCYMGFGVVLAGTGTSQGQILRSTNYGETWTLIGHLGFTTLVQFIHRAASYIAIASTQTQVGEDARFWRSTNNGLTWTELATDFGKHLGQIANFGSGILTSCAVNNSGVLHVWRSTDYGATWTDTVTLDTAAVSSWGAIALSTLVGLFSARFDDGTSAIYRSTDAGLTWKEIDPIFAKDPYAVVVDFVRTSDGQLLFSTAGDGTNVGGAQIWKSVDLGVTWGLVKILDRSISAEAWDLVETHKAGTLLAVGRLLRSGAPTPPAATDFTQAKWQTGIGRGSAPQGDVFYSEDMSNNYERVDSWGRFNAEQIPDACNGVFEHRSLVYATGPRSIEINYNQADPNQPWAFSDPSLPFGLLAPDSWVSWDQLDKVMYLTDTDNVIQVVQFQSRQQQQMSQEWAEILNDRTLVTSPATAKAWGVAIRGIPHYVITFPADNLTICYNVLTQHWWRWAYWNGASYEAAIINSYAHWKAEKRHLVGDRRPNGMIHALGGLTDNGDAIRFELTSGHVSAGSFSPKPVGRTLFKVQRGQATDASTPVFTWSVRDNGNQNFGTARSVSLGPTNDTEHFGCLNRCGMYNTRQTRVVHADTKSGFIFSEADES